MDQSVRIAAAASVLLGGLLAALLFRHESPREGPPGPETGDRLVLCRRMEPQQAADAPPTRCDSQTERAATATAAPPVPNRLPTVVKPRGPAEPPDLARAYPGVAAPVAVNWSPAVGNRMPDGPPDEGRPDTVRPDTVRPEEAAVRTHKIVDGDTLRTLSERYLGSPDRAWEIYEANRDVLPSPAVLPIGVQLKLPPRRDLGPSPSNYMPKRPLVPIGE